MEFRGIGACEGAVAATAVVFRHETAGETSLAEMPGTRELDFEAAMTKFREGRRVVYEELNAMAREAEKKYGADKAGIFEGFAEILMDEEIEESAAAYIREGRTAAQAARMALERQARELEALDGAYMKERGADLADIGRRLEEAVAGKTGTPLPDLTEPCILVADDLSPFETVRLDHRLIAGLAMDRGGYTGHVAILARSLGIPCVVALGNASAGTQTGSLCALDGTSGRFIRNPDEKTLAAFSLREKERQERIAVLAEGAGESARTQDGASILVCANIGSPGEAGRASAQGADGVGLFRTEFLYMDSTRLPSEDEQFAAYRKALSALGGKPLTIRTLDIGGDKEHPALGLEKEDNPFLGYRAVRASLDRPEIFKPQLRAILRAAAFGNVELMFPLIATLDEFRAARALVEECRAGLSSQGLEAGNPAVGIMVETPAAAILARELAAEADFFSVGTNDLTQYTLAADRGNARVASLYEPLNPAVLRLLAVAAGAAAEKGIPVSVCGELASDTKAVPLLIGLGIDKLSVSASRISGVKAEVRKLNREKCAELAARVLSLSTTGEVRAALDLFGQR